MLAIAGKSDHCLTGVRAIFAGRFVHAHGERARTGSDPWLSRGSPPPVDGSPALASVHGGTVRPYGPTGVVCRRGQLSPPRSLVSRSRYRAAFAFEQDRLGQWCVRDAGGPAGAADRRLDGWGYREEGVGRTLLPRPNHRCGVLGSVAPCVAPPRPASTLCVVPSPRAAVSLAATRRPA